MTVRLLDIAETELDEAVRYYESQAPGLGMAFLVEFLSAVGLISDHPHAWQSLDGEIRRCRLNRFPYGVIYTPVDGDIVVLAVGHLHRKPGHSRERLSREGD
ncbi:MAG: type II toxin-antitoxin system RelE/ParE family toxin [Hyphomicrobiales bacterium]